MEERFETFTVLVTKLSRAIRRIKTEEMAEFDLKSPHVSCLYYLYKENKLTAKELCDLSSEDKAALSRSIEYLEEGGYVSCEDEVGKRYKSPLTLTEKGREIGGKLAEKIDRVLSLAGEGVPEEHRLIMYKSLTLICQNLEKMTEEY